MGSSSLLDGLSDDPRVGALMAKVVSVRELRRFEMQRLGARARLLREQAGLTQEQVADAIGVSRVTVNRFEAGVNDLGSSRLVLLAQALGVPTAALWD